MQKKLISRENDRYGSVGGLWKTSPVEIVPCHLFYFFASEELLSTYSRLGST
jgi:hypothetical protein